MEPGSRGGSGLCRQDKGIKGGGVVPPNSGMTSQGWVVTWVWVTEGAMQSYKEQRFPQEAARLILCRVTRAGVETLTGRGKMDKAGRQWVIVEGERGRQGALPDPDDICTLTLCDFMDCITAPCPKHYIADSLNIEQHRNLGNILIKLGNHLQYSIALAPLHMPLLITMYMKQMSQTLTVNQFVVVDAFAPKPEWYLGDPKQYKKSAINLTKKLWKALDEHFGPLTKEVNNITKYHELRQDKDMVSKFFQMFDKTLEKLGIKPPDESTAPATETPWKYAPWKSHYNLVHMIQEADKDKINKLCVLSSTAGMSSMTLDLYITEWSNDSIHICPPTTLLSLPAKTGLQPMMGLVFASFTVAWIVKWVRGTKNDDTELILKHSALIDSGCTGSMLNIKYILDHQLPI
ncbi:hypothetical protein OBBRIDRAFT_800954 [Obba rivulosa]|uniref:Uncharacterized protein n=1 Tax=Obba rivulosa TaxID=1052685 RepID=A0A8E2J526_9APHY|nr:hypothetical protein OBBRIDRAFT_800954 [Obba rivulosa]